MTKERNDKHSTEFGLWLRKCKNIDSGLGYTASNLDYIWRNHNNHKWMLIEEKRFGCEPKFPQTELFDILDKAIKDEYYQGFHTIVFEATSPEDGWIKLDGKIITKEQLIRFLRFEPLEGEIDILEI